MWSYTSNRPFLFGNSGYLSSFLVCAGKPLAVGLSVSGRRQYTTKRRLTSSCYDVRCRSILTSVIRVSCSLPKIKIIKLFTEYTGLFEMIVAVLTTCHTQYIWDSSICVFFNRTTLQVFVTYLTGALYVHPLWFYKHQHDNRVRSACQRWWFQWRFWFVPSVPGYLQEEEEHKPDPWRNPIERNHIGLHLENEVAVVKTPTIISNNPVYTPWINNSLCLISIALDYSCCNVQMWS